MFFGFNKFHSATITTRWGILELSQYPRRFRHIVIALSTKGMLSFVYDFNVNNMNSENVTLSVTNSNVYYLTLTTLRPPPPLLHLKPVPAAIFYSQAKDQRNKTFKKYK